MFRKNSLASDFITSATLGLAGVCAMAAPGRTAHARAAMAKWRRVNLFIWVSSIDVAGVS
jgi:hypothetical protein